MAHLQNYHPRPVLELIRRIPTRQRLRFNQFKDIANKVAVQLLNERYRQHRENQLDSHEDGLSVLSESVRRICKMYDSITSFDSSSKYG